jgi:hypothetical protein
MQIFGLRLEAANIIGRFLFCTGYSSQIATMDKGFDSIELVEAVQAGFRYSKTAKKPMGEGPAALGARPDRTRSVWGDVATIIGERT